MKKILMFLMVSTAIFANYDECIQKANERFEKRSFIEASEYVTEALKEKESSKDYYFRARCHLGNMSLQLALEDLDKAIELNKIDDGLNLEEVYPLKYSCMSVLGKPMHEMIKTKEEWQSLPNMPRINQTEDGLLISNIQNESHRKFFKYLYQSKETVIEDLPNGDLLIKKKCNCGGGCCVKSISTKHYWSGCVGSCRWVFAGINVALIMAGSKFPNKIALGFVALAVQNLEGICIYCCEGADFDKDCVEPIRGQLKQLQDIVADILWGDPSKTDHDYESLEDLLENIG